MHRFFAAILLTFTCFTAHAEEIAPREVPATPEQVTLSYAPIVKRVAPAVVNIYTKRTLKQRVSPMFDDPLFRQFFGERFAQPRERVVTSLGSGVMVAANGEVITNYHVVKDAEDITVILNDRREYPATMTAHDEQFDLALLTLKGKTDNFPFLELQDSDAVEIGDIVFAIGNPFGVGQTVTHGIVSALARSAKGISDWQFFIQTDAPINPGNSGGALIDMQGKLIGVPTAIYSKTGGSNGIGFATPSNVAKVFLSQRSEKGVLQKPWIGSIFQPVTAPIADSLGMRVPRGVLVAKVGKDTPGAKAGLKTGDVITEFNGQPVDDPQSLRYRAAIAGVGSEAKLVLLRQGKETEVSMPLELPPEKPARDQRTLSGPHPFAGIIVSNINPAVATELEIDSEQSGVVVVDAGGARMLRRFAPGDRLLKLNNIELTSTRQFDELLQRTRGGWKLQYEHDGQILNLAIMP